MITTQGSGNLKIVTESIKIACAIFTDFYHTDLKELLGMP